MEPEPQWHPRQILEENLDLVARILRSIAYRRRLSPEEAEELSSFVHLKLVEDDYRILGRFEGRSSLKTYLTVVVQRLFLDHRVRRWGKWRPSAAARRRGPVAVLLEQLTHRDGFSLAEAIEMLATNHRVGLSAEQLEALAARLPCRIRRRFESAEGLDGCAATERADTGVVEGERAALAERAHRALAAARRALPPEDRKLVELRHDRGLTVAEIARTLGVPQKPLYRRLDVIRRRLRRELERAGLSADQLAPVLRRTD